VELKFGYNHETEIGFHMRSILYWANNIINTIKQNCDLILTKQSQTKTNDLIYDYELVPDESFSDKIKKFEESYLTQLFRQQNLIIIELHLFEKIIKIYTKLSILWQKGDPDRQSKAVEGTNVWEQWCSDAEYRNKEYKSPDYEPPPYKDQLVPLTQPRPPRPPRTREVSNLRFK
jgi:hypothetical protein